MKREPRLHFSDADLAEPKLKKPIKRVEKAAAKAFTSSEDDRMYLKGCVSRKKQIIPQLTEALS